MYNAKIVSNNGEVLNLGFDYGVIFDITPLSGTDIEVSTSQSFQQIGESVENSSALGLTREIYGVIIDNERATQEKLFKIFSAFSLSPWPMAMAARGAPPEPAIMAKAVMSMRMGVNRPTPVRARPPISGIWPI